MKKAISNLVSLILIAVMLVNTFSPMLVLAAETMNENSGNAVVDSTSNEDENATSANDSSELNETEETENEQDKVEEKGKDELDTENGLEQNDALDENADLENKSENEETEQDQNTKEANSKENEVLSENESSKDEPMVINDDEQKEIVPMDKNIGKGNIEVETHLLLPIRNREKNNITFKIYDSLQNSAKIDLNKVNEPKDGFYTGTITLGNQTIRFSASERDKDGNLLSGVDYDENVVYLSVNLFSLDKGNYTIELSGKGFVTFKQNVTLENYSQRIMITDEKGLFEIGDVNSDGVVDSKDSENIKSFLGSTDSKYDLNLDGIVDIADLNYVTATIKGTKKTVKIESTGAIMQGENISFEVGKKSLAKDSADLSSLFSDEGVVKFQKTDDKPIELGIDLSGEKEETVEMSQIRITVGDNVPKEMKLLVETETGEIIEKIVSSKVDNNDLAFTDDVTKGTVKIDLGKQVAVKKVTIVITETSTNNLADIAKVEFLNNVKTETKQPDNFYTPKNIKVDGSVSEQFTITFESVPNVTGYEIKVVGPKMNTIFQTTYTSFVVEDIKNYETYKISVQSVNQEWKSGWSDEVDGVAQATRKPPKVDMVKATPTYSGIDFSWKDMDDTKSYNLYYRQAGAENFETIKNIEKNSYQLRGLRAATEYEAYITGVNDLGESESYTTVKAKTLESGAAIVPRYNLINDEYDQKSGKTTHIENVYYGTGTMTNDNKYSIVDDEFATYWSKDDWQISASVGFNANMPIIVLDGSYIMDEFVITVPDSYAPSYKSGGVNSNDIKVHYWENAQEKYNDTNRKEVNGTLIKKTDENKRVYYVLKLADPITAKAVGFGLTVENNVRDIKIDEVKFYGYDSLVDDVAALFTDDLRLELADGVTQTRIDELRKRADEKDHDEYSPYRDSVIADLDYAEKILKDEKIDDVITLNPNISNSYNGHTKFAMTISDYQPLGIVARPGETLNVYVGTKGKVNVQIIFTQYHAEAGEWNKAYTTEALHTGLNIITVPTIGSSTDERGGSVYIRYTSAPDLNNPIKVRVSGGTKIPMLDTTLLSDDTSKKAAIKSYIEELYDYNSKLGDVYTKEGKTFDKKKSVLGSTEIVTKYGLLSVSSMAVESALKSGTTDLNSQVERLFESTEAFDEMMLFFYRQKGFSENTTVKTDATPKARINIRYMQMFDGAFMYAGGYHVGIEYGSIAGLIQGSRNSSDKTGYFGWGISHEIGHQINQKDTVFAEVTNNIYALLAQTSNDSDLSRLEIQGYDKIYEKVTSHTLGRAQNVFVQLGMYWQLHLAYDENKTFEDPNSIYARINKISRSYDNKNGLSRDELTIVFASEAAGKDLTEFFEVWGLVATDKVKQELASLNLPKETRPIYYLNDSARRFKLSGKSGISSSNILTASIEDANSQDKRVTLNFNVSADSDKILGYEILRNDVSIGFVLGNVNTFTDNVGAENNRAYTYKVVAYDYLLNKTNTVTLDEVKISHDGSVKKDTFTISSNVKESGEVVDNENEDLDDTKLHVNNLIDGNGNTGFKGNEKIKVLNQTSDKPSLVTDNGNAYVIINLNNRMSVSGIKYRALVENGELATNTINKYKVSVSSDGTNWIVARTGTFNLSVVNPEATIYFMGQNTDSESQLWTYNDISYIKIESDGNKVGLSGAEIDVIAPPGDNVELNEASIGVLDKDYCYLTGGCDPTKVDDNGDVVGVIKEGSVIIQGNYRGNPAFNNVLIADASDEKKPYSGYFLLFAELNSDNSVYDVADGTWIYVMTKEQYEKMISESKSIRAYLYRVNDAITNDGQRLTSTSKYVTNLKDYESLSKVEIESKMENK